MRTWIVIMLMAAVALGMGSCKMAFRALRYNVPSVHDHKLWPARTVKSSGKPASFQLQPISLPTAEEFAFGKWVHKGMSAERFFEQTGTTAFLMLRGDTLLYENYFNGCGPETVFNTFSTSKVFLSALLGIAIEEGYIGGLDQSAGDYLPWCTDSVLCSVKLRHLLQMTSGIHSTEGYLNPWSTSTKLYYGDQVNDLVHSLELKRRPGERFFYQNINSQLLGMVIAEATGRPLGTYLEEKIWKPLGMQADASWSLHEGTNTEKAFCCLNARARDFARFGVLYLNKGKHGNVQIVPEAWATLPLKMDTTEGASFHYQYAWYTNLAREDFYAQGLLGQFIYIHPASRTVIVRLGNNLEYNVPWYDVFRFISGIQPKPKPIAFSKTDLEPMAGRWDFGVGKDGDSSMVGKWVDIRATRKGLRVKSDFQKTWTAIPSSSMDFFNLDFGRYLRFEVDSSDAITRLHWSRRGLNWPLEKREKGISKNR